MNIQTSKFIIMRIFSFEELNVWQKARHLLVKIYKTTKDFPSEVKIRNTSQMKRTAVSISSNIVKGTG